MTSSLILTASRSRSAHTGAAAVGGSVRVRTAPTISGVTMGRLRSSSLQVELCNLILALVLDHFALGSAPAEPNFFLKIKIGE